MDKKMLPNDKFLPEVIKLLNEGHTVTLPLRGRSMRPFLEHDRDKAILTALNGNNVAVGDAVLAEIKPREYVLHRIIKIEGEAVTLCGDGNLSFEHCRISDIKAKAVAFYRKNRNNPDSVDERKWKVYSWIWMRLYPIRRYLLFIHRQYLKL